MRPRSVRLASRRPSPARKRGRSQAPFGRNYIYETIDFGLKRPKLIRERSGWMAYMFNDIKLESPNTEAFSIIRLASDDGGEAAEYAKAILGGDSQLIDRRDDVQRKRFLNDRQRVAESIG